MGKRQQRFRRTVESAYQIRSALWRVFRIDSL
jgi:hypothetical protein